MNLAWLAAVLTPSEVGPVIDGDPRAGDNPESDLAALVLGRSPSWRRGARFESESNLPQDTQLQLAEQLMHAGRQEAGIDELSTILIDGDAHEDVAKTTALALLSAPFIAWRDQFKLCEAVLMAAMRRIEPIGSSHRLLLASLHAQMALRRRDHGGRFLDDVSRCLELLSDVDASECTDFALSKSSRATPYDVADRMIATLQHAAWSLVPGGPFIDENEYGSSPANEHKRPLGWTVDELRIASDATLQYGRWLDELYNSEFQRAGVITWGRSEPDLFYQTLALELRGHRSAFVYRRQLAMMRIVRSFPSLLRPDMASCLQLLRHSESEKELESLVGRIQRGGPLDALAVDCRQIISNRLQGSSIRAVELIVLAAGADLLAQNDAEKALSAVLELIEQDGPRAAPGAFRVSSKRHEGAWRAATALGNAAGAASLVADRLHAEVLTQGVEDELWDRVVARTVRGIYWPDVSQPVRQLWELLVAEPSRSATETAQAVRTALQLTPAVMRDTDESLDWALLEINQHLAQHTEPSTKTASKMLEIGLVGMQGISSRAQRGVYSGYSVDAAEIAAHALLFLRSVDDFTWTAFLEFLTNPIIARSDKTLCFDTLTAPEIRITPSLVSQYRHQISETILSDDIDFVAPDVSFKPYPAALRFAFAHNFISDDEAFTYVAQLLSIRDTTALEEAAATVTSFSRSSSAGWIQTMAVQLSHDFNPRVRAEIIHALARISERESQPFSIATRRLSELLREDGISVPSNALSAVSRMKNIPTEMRETLNTLRANHPSRRIRQQAAAISTDPLNGTFSP